MTLHASYTYYNRAYVIAGNNEGLYMFSMNTMKRLPTYAIMIISSHPDYQVAESCKLDLDYSDEHSDFRKTTFPARHIYERLLPSVVQKHCDIYYHRSSPYSGYGKPTTDKTYGDLHQCELFRLLFSFITSSCRFCQPSWGESTSK